MPPPQAIDEAIIPVLLRAARTTYSNAIGSRLAAEGFNDMPRSGPFVLGGMANHGGSAGDLIHALGVSKQAASQLIDTLVIRGYLARQVNRDDRRRLTIDLTERGQAAARVIRAGVEAVDAELAQALSTTALAALRSGLAVLAEIDARAA